MTGLTIEHGSFTLTQSYKAAPARVRRAFSDPADKRRWFVDSPGFSTFDYRLDCRCGGSEFWHGTAPDGTKVTMSARITEARPGARLVLSYEMTLNGRLLSLSLLTVEFRPDGAGTALTLTEHVAHLDGLGTTAERKGGTEGLLAALGAHLDG